MMFLIRFWKSLNKKDSVERVVKFYEEEIVLLVLQFFLLTFLQGSGYGLGEKKSDPDPEHWFKPRIRGKAIRKDGMVDR